MTREQRTAYEDLHATTPGMTVDREGIRVVTLEKLAELKLASSMDASHRLRDLADVQDLIVRLKLPHVSTPDSKENLCGDEDRQPTTTTH